MKILLYGENWEGTHVDTIYRVLTEKKIECKIFDFFTLLSYHTPVVLANRILRRLFYSRNEAVINKLLLAEIDEYKPDVLLISKGVNIYPETLLAFQKRSIFVANWNQDDFFNRYNASRHLDASLGIYDYVFSPRKHLFEAYHAAGIRKLAFLEWYYVPWLHKKPVHTGVMERKISFIGSHSKHREKVIDSINGVHPVEVWGAGWGLSSLRNKKNVRIHNKVMKQSLFPEMISNSLVNLNILTVENNDVTNLKIFEITACDGLLLTDFNQYTADLLKDGALYYSHSGNNELNEKLEYIFDPANAKEIEQVKEQGYATITNGHNTINDRVAIVLDILTKEIA